MPPKKKINKKVEATERRSGASNRSRRRRAAVENKERAFRIRTLEVTNFKALDHLVLSLPIPRMANDPDVFVLGSRNGLGKTSVLEACALLLTAARMPKRIRKELLSMFYRAPDRFYRAPERRYERHVNLSDLFVRSGTETSKIKVCLNVGKITGGVDLQVSRSGSLEIKPDERIERFISDEELFGPWEIEQLIESLASFSPEPLVMPPLLYFHSYRKVSEGAPEFGAWIERGPTRRKLRRPGDWSTGAFKIEILSLLMRKAELFETEDNGKAESVEALDQLNSLIERYAGGRIEKVLPAPDNTIDFRIIPTVSGGRSFSFDGLSSGQKEVISTLFLVWRYTRVSPCIILIDEPELHLNPEWQRDFVQQIHKITPNSQIIIATHSEDVFGSVPEDRRILLGE